jgi:hypothetical protein
MVVIEFRYVGICISTFKNFIEYKPTILESPTYCKEKNISYLGSATVRSRVIMQAARQQLICVANIINYVPKLRWLRRANVLCRMHCADTLLLLFVFLCGSTSP